jgi:hypothetical protein
VRCQVFLELVGQLRGALLGVLVIHLAARAGKHVLVDKPMDIILPGVDRIIRATQETGGNLGASCPAISCAVCAMPSRPWNGGGWAV